MSTLEERKRYNRERRLRQRRLFDEVKMARGCVDCGFKSHPAALDLDHRDPATKTNHVGKMYGRTNTDNIYAEVDKCDVRCANCHRIKTFGRTT